MKMAFLFPGQGAQVVGMGQALADAFPAARAVFEEVDDALNQKLSAIIWDGPENALTLTENAQPAIMATSVAALRVMEAELGMTVGKNAALVAGHSLGEYSALCAAGVFTLADTARLLRIRGAAMQAAVPVDVGAMAALLGLDVAQVEPIAAQAAEQDICMVANDNAAGQVVISGHKAAVERAVDLAKAAGAKRAVLLTVSAPFHCSLMEPAARAMADALEKSTATTPAVPLVANVTAEQVFDAAVIKNLLVQQVTGRVRWRESMHYLRTQGVTRVVEIGHGKVLTGLMKRIEPDITTLNIAEPADLDALAKSAA